MASSNSTVRSSAATNRLSTSLNLPSKTGGVAGQPRNSSRPKDRPSSSSTSAPRRSVVASISRSHSKDFNDENDSVRVRVAVRVRPRNSEELISDADSVEFVELQPEIKRLKLKKNNWNSEAYRFDEIFTETASQKRIYEAVAKPVVESVLDGYNGTVMAYGQTGTGKTYTVGNLGKNDPSERGIMVRALEDVMTSTASASDSVEISFLQLYMESIQDLLAPEKTNLAINEDPKTGEVSLPGATVVKVEDLECFLQILQIGEANRHAANTKLNTESSRSHAILMVYVRRSVHDKLDGINSGDKGVPKVRKSKLLIVDLAGSERMDKSGKDSHLIEEAKYINLSLTSLGKCINALAENSSHIPIRDSKLTRLLRDSFGGSARTSLIITIGPSVRYHAETTSTIMFGQRAMKVVNITKLKEEFDYESSCRNLEVQVDNLTAEVERQKKLRDDDKNNLEKRLRGFQDSFAEAEKNLAARSEFLEKENARMELEMEDILNELTSQKDQNNTMHDKVIQLEMSLKRSKQQQLENSKHQKTHVDTTQMYEKKIAELIKQIEDEQAQTRSAERQLDEMKNLLSKQQKLSQKREIENVNYQKALADTNHMYEKKIEGLMKQLEDEHAQLEAAEEQLGRTRNLLSNHQNSTQIDGQKEIEELNVKLREKSQLYQLIANELHSLKSDYDDLSREKDKLTEELQTMKQRFLAEEKERKTIESELVKLKNNAPEIDNDFEDKRPYIGEGHPKSSSTAEVSIASHRSNALRKSLSGQRATISRLCEEVGVQKVLELLKSEDLEVQIQAAKVVANLASEEHNQVKIVEEGGLDALLMLLESSQNTTILRVSSGAIANLAMNERIQDLIMNRGGAELLAKTVSKSEDPQTLRMIAGALANLCGNEKLLVMLKEDGALTALLGMVRSRNSDIIAQVARGIANFAKCETREILEGRRKGRSLLMEDGVLEWLISNSGITSASSRRHIELALCHLAQNEENAEDFISKGGVQDLIRISVESSRDDIRNLAKKILKSNSALQTK